MTRTDSRILPLGRGYPDPEGFLSEYLRPDRDPAACTPSLGVSLDRLCAADAVTSRLRRLPRQAVCVIEGCSAPGNSHALSAFLEALGVEAPRILAFDLIDVPAVWRDRGIPHPDFDFRAADAADLRGVIGDASCDLFVQDHLLNCAPHGLHAGILAEAARILKPGGIGLIHVTDDRAVEALPRLARAEVESRFGVRADPLAYGLAGLAAQNGRLEALRQAARRSILTGESEREAILVTEPYGHFEFYRPVEDSLDLIARAGLRTYAHSTHSGIDSQGLLCRRHYLLVGLP